MKAQYGQQVVHMWLFVCCLLIVHGFFVLFRKAFWECKEGFVDVYYVFFVSFVVVV